LPILAQKLSRIGDWGGSNLDANSLQSGSVLDAIQQTILIKRKYSPVLGLGQVILKSLKNQVRSRDMTVR
jgi:hypothetical protein